MDTLNFGVIGTGRFGKHYIRLLGELAGVKLAATASRHENNADGLLENPDIDCMVIASPASTHFEYIKRALEAGKHVLVEKPMVLSAAEAEEVKKMAAKTGKTFMVAHQYLYHDKVRYLKEQIELGGLGKLGSASMQHIYPGPIREDVGVFWDAAPHELAILDYLLGQRTVLNVKGKAEKDTVSVEFEFGGAQIKLDLSSVAEKKVRRREFIGDKGRAVFDDSDNNSQLQITTLEGNFVPVIESREPLRNELEHFIECVQTGKTPLTDIEHGLRVIRNLEFVSKHLNRG